MSFEPSQVKTVIFNQNQAHRVNIGQTTLTRIKMIFRSIMVKTIIFNQIRLIRITLT
jgi:hypothetical protein